MLTQGGGSLRLCRYNIRGGLISCGMIEAVCFGVRRMRWEPRSLCHMVVISVCASHIEEGTGVRG